MADRIKSRYPGVYYRLDAGGNRRYCVSFRGSDGKRHWETVAGGEADARARKAELERKLSRGEPVQASKVLFEKFTNDWLAGQTQLKPKTIELYSSALDVHLIPRFGKMQVQKISKEHVADFIGELVGKGLKAWTIRGIITPLRGAMGHAVWVGILPANPVNQVPRSMRPKTDAKKMRVLSFEEIDVLLKAAPKRYRTLLATAIFTGLRFGELLALRWEDIDFGRGFIRVGDSKTESGAHREVVMMPSLASRLLEHRLESGPEGLVFASETGSKLDQHNVRRRGLEKAVGGAKIEAVRFQELRHTFASIMIGQGHDVVFVSRQLGHANAAITLRIYAHLFDQQSKADEARAALEERFGSLL